jgi:HEAT repeats
MQRQNNEEMAANLTEKMKSAACGEFEQYLVLLAAGEELDVAEQAEVADHLKHCAVCAASLARERDLLSVLSENRSEPDAALLTACRAELVDALDREEERGWVRRTVGVLLPTNWVSPRPAWTAALLLMLGFSVGVLAPRFLRHAAALPPSSASSVTADAAGTEAVAMKSIPPASSSLGTLDLHTADVAGINVFPSGSSELPRVELQLKAQQPMTVQGTVNNDDVKRVLLYVLHNNDRFDPEVRLDAVDLLRMRNNDPDVRSALCHAVHTDHNAAVRLKALEALNGAEPQDLIRQTLLDALVDDQNPGVRVEAINALRELAADGKVESDDHMLAVLRDRMKKDPSTYIRLQSAAAIRDLGPRQKF